jgi:hypothetical protein
MLCRGETTLSKANVLAAPANIVKTFNVNSFNTKKEIEKMNKKVSRQTVRSDAGL